jgi:hypothetical protein
VLKRLLNAAVGWLVSQKNLFIPSFHRAVECRTINLLNFLVAGVACCNRCFVCDEAREFCRLSRKKHGIRTVSRNLSGWEVVTVMIG